MSNRLRIGMVVAAGLALAPYGADAFSTAGVVKRPHSSLDLSASRAFQATPRPTARLRLALADDTVPAAPAGEKTDLPSGTVLVATAATAPGLVGSGVPHPVKVVRTNGTSSRGNGAPHGPPPRQNGGRTFADSIGDIFDFSVGGGPLSAVNLDEINWGRPPVSFNWKDDAATSDAFSDVDLSDVKLALDVAFNAFMDPDSAQPPSAAAAPDNAPSTATGITGNQAFPFVPFGFSSGYKRPSHVLDDLFPPESSKIIAGTDPLSSVNLDTINWDGGKSTTTFNWKPSSSENDSPYQNLDLSDVELDLDVMFNKLMSGETQEEVEEDATGDQPPPNFIAVSGNGFSPGFWQGNSTQIERGRDYAKYGPPDDYDDGDRLSDTGIDSYYGYYSSALYGGHDEFREVHEYLDNFDSDESYTEIDYYDSDGWSGHETITWDEDGEYYEWEGFGPGGSFFYTSSYEDYSDPTYNWYERRDQSGHLVYSENSYGPDLFSGTSQAILLDRFVQPYLKTDSTGTAFEIADSDFPKTERLFLTFNYFNQPPAVVNGPIDLPLFSQPFSADGYGSAYPLSSGLGPEMLLGYETGFGPPHSYIDQTVPASSPDDVVSVVGDLGGAVENFMTGGSATSAYENTGHGTIQDGGQTFSPGTQLQLGFLPYTQGSILPTSSLIKLFYQSPDLPMTGGSKSGDFGFNMGPLQCGPTTSSCPLKVLDSERGAFGLGGVVGPSSVTVEPLVPHSFILINEHIDGPPPPPMVLETTSFSVGGEAFQAVHAELPAMQDQAWNAWSDSYQHYSLADNCFTKQPAPNPGDLAEFSPGRELPGATVHVASAKSRRP